MQTKHFFSDPIEIVNSALASLTLTNPSLAFDRPNKIIYRRPTPESATNPKVSIVSGGGSGHEPAFAGFVGKGLLTAAVAGTIFASPSAEQVRTAVMERIETSKGVFVIAVNYTGDVMNFGMATEKAKAAGIKAEFFAIGDDVGVGRTKGGRVGRRGIGGSILVLKIAGALAESGSSLDDVYRISQLAAANIVSLGASLEHVHVPGRGIPDTNSDEMIPHDEIEVGMGIHNEPGSDRIKATGEELIKRMLVQLLDQNDKDRAFLKYSASDEFVLLINNLGAVSTLELSAVTSEVTAQLARDYCIKPVRIIQGAFLTSLNGVGFSISLLRLVDTGLGPGKSLLDLLDSPSEAVGWSAPVATSTWENRSEATYDTKKAVVAEETPSNFQLDPTILKKVLTSGLNRVIDAEPLITKYDTIVGDGDCGIGLKRGAQAILSYLDAPPTPLTYDLVTSLHKIITIVENTMDGTSGAVYAIFLNALAHGLREQAPGSAPKPVTPKVWSAALHHSLRALGKYTPAQVGDRTLIDALAPFITTLAESGDLGAAVKAAEDATEATKHMKASLGRAVYVGGEEEWIGKVPDPGAFGLAQFLRGVADAV
ncbi:dihydroxyacetone kinase [Histoplasma capsulatum var. duboisii H88]|uniref:Dihydroxyacetone kinase n=2 Tax=Ajellomyces capsulatus TaxID=5037 RepID=F0UHB3_AJEC8|nr:dihydroxyacetone kinase [Histoplasma capsulatum H143]EGC44460.1 dihydroxyacetone kinase [Histoplasma capsulatum var. duboisii H88]QSS55234.1 dihydroxyacetone kinase [Histoplasma capsulatum var. duboisii H88]